MHRLNNYLKTKKMNLGGGSVRINPAGVLLVAVVFILFVYFNLGGNNGGAVSSDDLESYLKMSDSVSLKSLLAVSIEMARRGGAEVKRIREQVRQAPSNIRCRTKFHCDGNKWLPSNKSIHRPNSQYLIQPPIG